MDVVEFDYTDAKGKQSHRVVFPLAKPSDRYFAIDLTEFDESERAFYVNELQAMYKVMEEEIRQLGLGSNYRYFIEERTSGTKG
jgi:hypothetical protein